jgi:hypothetical protein
VLDEHDRTDARWLEYELDAAKLLDFPVMIDMRDPLTTRFQKAKLRADFHRPLRAEDLLDGRDAARQYFDAVENYVSAFTPPKRRRYADAEATSHETDSSGWRVPRAYCVWPQTPPRRRRNVSMHMHWRVPNLTTSSCCGKTPEPASSAESSAKSTGRSPNRPGCPDIFWFRRSVGRPASLLKSAAKSSAKMTTENLILTWIFRETACESEC